MAVISLRDVSFSYGAGLLLDGVSLRIEAGERICLVGRNGAGKSTLMKLINGELEGYRGEIIRESGIKLARLGQSVPKEAGGTVYDKVTMGLGNHAEMLLRYHHLSEQLAQDGHDKLLKQLDQLHLEMDTQGVWKLHQLVETVLSRMSLCAEAAFGSLSAGLKRRTLLAQALVSDPDVLLLDEPTNHLDVDAIEWLEEFLSSYKGTLVFVTHDRVFMDKLGTRLVEIDRGRLRSWECRYESYVARKTEELEVEAKQNAAFDKKLAQEEVWIRKGVKERRTRNEGRVRALKKMREERRQRRQVTGSVKMQVQQAELSGKVVIKTQGLRFAYPGMAEPIVKDLTMTVMRGDRIGIMGPNGSGKTTLLKLLLGELQGQAGTVEHGERLEAAYFDQLHAALAEDKSVYDNVADGSDKITISGVTRHVIGYLQDFLFVPERSRHAVHLLSGGERNRLLLAKLFTKPSNVLVLDEPTNDLDADTLELLEDILMEYRGTILMVSHDRAFLDHVVTSLLVMEGHGQVREFIGGYNDWLRVREIETQALHVEQKALAAEAKMLRQAAKDQAKPRRLKYMEKKELEMLPSKIEAAEAAVAVLHETMGHPELYKQGPDKIAAMQADLTRLESQLTELYARWEELDGLAE